MRKRGTWIIEQRVFELWRFCQSFPSYREALRAIQAQEHPMLRLRFDPKRAR